MTAVISFLKNMYSHKLSCNIFSLSCTCRWHHNESCSCNDVCQHAAGRAHNHKQQNQYSDELSTNPCSTLNVMQGCLLASKHNMQQYCPSCRCGITFWDGCSVSSHCERRSAISISGVVLHARQPKGALYRQDDMVECMVDSPWL